MCAALRPSSRRTNRASTGRCGSPRWSDYQQNRWFVNFMIRLLQGEPAVLRLMEYNPFPRQPPKFVRARLYLYHFTHFGERAWWKRSEGGEYFPPVSLR